ncbi:MAG: hypothetical protein AB1641_21010 [Thermodesulfobacteriota bacterium]
MRNADYHTADVKRICENKLKIAFRHGHEFNGWFELNGIKMARITIPKGRKPIPPKTYKSMSMQLKLTVEQFDRLLECPLSLDQYQEILMPPTK